MSTPDTRDAAQLAEMAAIDQRTDEAHRFLDLLFSVGATPIGARITLSVPNPVWKPGETARWLSAHVPVEKTRLAAERALASDVLSQHNVYFGCALTCGDLGAFRRGKVDEKVAIPGVWCDLDIVAPGHAASNLPTFDEARTLLVDLALPPTVLVHSGGGLHPWWLFADGPWTLHDAGEREFAGRLVAGLQVQLGQRMQVRGWHLDSTADLTRVLRLPGTTNYKIAGNPRPVQILTSDGPRHDRAALLARFEPMAPKRTAARPKNTAGCGRQLTDGDERPSLLVRAFELAGMLGDEISDGRFTVVCPWEHQHTTGRRFDTSTIIWPPTTSSRLGWFCCLHGHCKGRSLDEVLAALPTEAVAKAQAEHDAEQRAGIDAMLVVFAPTPTAPPIPKQSIRDFCQARMKRLQAARPKRTK